jgi:AraC family transcriptional regulator, regulatory protein of adaptative response / methylated-DNA-[protein]-cysteine methyltransferase
MLMQDGAVPSLDWEICERARITRDRRYDGVFFTAVRSTGIYCRPICPVHPARPKNVIFFRTAAEAEKAGFRPCLRCRPETAPGSPAWLGTETTVIRGMRMIEEGFLDGGTVAQLADRLGVGPRHLCRLFMRHVGAGPSAVASTRRIQAAKRLIDGSDLSLAEIAFAVGFGSVRRFNAAFLQTYARPPSSLRRAARRSDQPLVPRASHHDRRAAVDGEDMAVDEGRGVRGEKDGGAGNLLRPSPAPHRRAPLE